jgi:hypothetical protein
VVDYGYCPPVSVVDGTATSPSSAAGGSSSTTVIVNDSCVVCRRPGCHSWPMAVHETECVFLNDVLLAFEANL